MTRVIVKYDKASETFEFTFPMNGGDNQLQMRMSILDTIMLVRELIREVKDKLDNQGKPKLTFVRGGGV